MTQHFVTFLSPGTFIHETTDKPIDSWDVEAATKMADTILERHGATPFGFYFTTRTRSDTDLDSKQSAKSPTYYLGGTVRTVDEVRSEALPDERILLSNMECNHWNRIITNQNSWKITQPLRDGDVILDYIPPHKRKP